MFRKSFKIIEEIDSMGGAIEAIETGWIENQISRSSYEYQKNVDNKTNIVIGVNKHKDEVSRFKTQLEESTDEDKIRFDIAGTEEMVMDAVNKLHKLKAGEWRNFNVPIEFLKRI